MSFHFYLYRAAENLPPMDQWETMRAEGDGLMHFVVMNKAAPSTMRKVCEALKLNTIAAPEAGDLVDIHAYEDGNRHDARKGGTP